ncbi:GNAT family N-acetyltransferase [Nocardia carnea]|uniref:GNAT family N-acetyltransferase n=1 Tax=Nocardia carnea TaxID=37328 RepID=UPI002453FA5E|nr:GNAT family protein [Nocardia carnea]
MLISDGVIGLRPIEVADAAAYLAARDREPVRRTSGPGTPNMVAEFERCAAEWAANGPRKTFAVVDVATHTLAGVVDVTLEPEFLAKRQADIGYDIHASWRARGVVGRAIVLACRYLARHDLADEAVLRLDPADTAALALAHRLGFHYHRSSTGPEGALDWFLQAL